VLCWRVLCSSFVLKLYIPYYDSSQIMIGYSDSAKDAGRLSASWAQYETQEALVRFFTLVDHRQQ
jgi:phosphoenolpyruvate carboxylase